jgi:glycosyltransferase involved in cell wall biosynthesis
VKILILHNFYQQKGGEDEIFDTEASLLASHGHEVIRHTVHNDAVKEMGQLQVAAATVWNTQSYRELRELARREKPDVAHFHNTFPLISPAGYHAMKDEGVPVIQTLHNYRLLCPSAIFFRDGRVCEDCLHKSIPWPGVVHKCYRGSLPASATVATMLTTHNALGTWHKKVDLFIAYSQFARQKFIEAGYPQSKLVFKTNCLHPSPAVGQGRGDYGLFVGRLTVEKGVRTLLEAWEKLAGAVPLKIIGDGPLADEVVRRSSKNAGVEFLGRRPLSEVYDLMGDARFLVMPSQWYETFGRVIIEAFAKGTPVIASKIGAVGELVAHQHTGLHFAAGNAHDLAAQVLWLKGHPEDQQRMRLTVRQEFENKYTADANYQTLISIYQKAALP